MIVKSDFISFSELTINSFINSLADDDNIIIIWSQSELLRILSLCHKDLSSDY